MKIINPDVIFIPQLSGIEGSALEFTNRMIKSGHHAMLEHGTVYLDFTDDWQRGKDRYIYNKYSKVYKNTLENGWLAPHLYVTTNLRVLVQNNWLDDLQYLCEPTEYHEKRYTFKFITGIDITREFNRHRVNSMAESSTIFCNFSKDKFGNELSIVNNVDLSEEQIYENLDSWDAFDYNGKFNYDACFRDMCQVIGQYEDDSFNIIDTWLFGNLATEWSYMKLINLGWLPKQARRILPLDTKSELVHTAFISDWKHFLSLRSSDYGAKGMHPDANYLANKLYSIFTQNEIL